MHCIPKKQDLFCFFFHTRWDGHDTISDLSFVSADIKSESNIIAFLDANGCSLSAKLGKKVWNLYLIENGKVVTLRDINSRKVVAHGFDILGMYILKVC